MSVKKMPVGAEPKKVAILIGLLVIAVVVFFVNSSGSPEIGSVSSPPSPARTAPPSALPGDESPIAPPSTAARGRRTFEEFKPSLRRKRGEPAPDPMTVDPVLRTDLLARLQEVDVGGSRRNIFEFGAAPPPKPDPATIASAKAKAPSPIVDKIIEPPKPAEEEVKPPKPQAPPIPLKFYGFVNPSSTPKKRAFFVEGEEIHVVWEGDLVKKRYKVVRIGVNSVVVEDTQFGQQQTLPLEAQPG